MADYSLFIAKAPGVMANLINDFSLSVDEAAAIIGNIGHECAGFRLLQEQHPIHGGRGGWGWCQWTGPRRDQFEQWAREHGFALDSDEANYGFLKHELQTTEAGAMTALHKTSSLEEAVRVFEQHFERADPHYKGYASREHYAQIARDAYRKAQGATGVQPDFRWTPIPDTPPATGLSFGARGPQVEALQESLIALDYPVGKKDGIFGKLTLQAVLAFQAENGLPTSGTVDDATWKALGTASPRALAPERVAATPQDLLQLGSTIIENAFRTKNLGWIAGILGALGLTNSAALEVAKSASEGAASASAGGAATGSPNALEQVIGSLQAMFPAIKNASTDQLNQIRTALQTLNPPPPMKSVLDIGGNPHAADSGIAWLSTTVGSILPGFGGSLLTLGIGIAAHALANRVAESRTRDHNKGLNIGR